MGRCNAIYVQRYFFTVIYSGVLEGIRGYTSYTRIPIFGFMRIPLRKLVFYGYTHASNLSSDNLVILSPNKSKNLKIIIKFYPTTSSCEDDRKLPSVYTINVQRFPNCVPTKFQKYIVNHCFIMYTYYLH